jgi:hypothetical protein
MTLDNWTEMTDAELTGDGYRNTVRGWTNTETSAEVLVFEVEGTGLEDVSDQPWAVQHPYTDDNTTFVATREAAEHFAREWMAENPMPENSY